MKLQHISVTLCYVCLAFTTGAYAAKWDHVHLLADNPEKAADWYAAQFGGERFAAGPFPSIQIGETTVKFKKGGDGFEGSEGTVVDHIGFSVEDVETKVKALEAAGCTAIGQPRRLEQGGFSFAFVLDPWGTKIEILDDPDMTGFHHVHLRSQNPEATLDWFHETFGGETANFRDLGFLPGIRWGEMWLLVQPSREPLAPNANRAIEHIGWKTDTIQSTWDSVQKQELNTPVPLRDGGGYRLMFVESPEGVKIEVQELVE